jgi:hypothetical protein
MREVKGNMEVKTAKDRFVELTNNIQLELAKESGFEDDAGVMEWLMSNAAKFREIFKQVWEEIKDDEHYADAIKMMENGDNHVLKESLKRLVVERMAN